MQTKTQYSALAVTILTALTATPVRAVPDDSAFRTDSVEKYVQDQASSAFDEANKILCYIGQLKAESFINTGFYVALNDTSKCDKTDTSAAASGGQGGASSNNAATYERITVNVTQSSSTQPVIVNAWVEESDSGITMPVKATITQTPTASNPLGKFRLDWGEGTDNQGLLQSIVDTQGRNVLQLFETYHGNELNSKRVSLIKTGESTGIGSAEEVRGNSSQIFNVAFNTNNFYRATNSATACFNRYDPDVSVWRYGLYNATNGARVNAESGWPIKKGNYYGWAGYWGIWLPTEAELRNGDTVQKSTFTGTAGDSYTVFKAGGKLIKNEKETLTLNDIKGIPLNVWIDQNHGFQVEWNEGGFSKKQAISCEGDDGCSFSAASGILDTASMLSDLNGYSDSLGGSVYIRLRDNSNSSVTLTDVSPAIVYKRTTVMPGDTSIPTVLKCHDNCLSAADGTSSSSLTPINYTFNTTDMLLKQGGTAVIPSNSWSSGQRNWWMGALVGSNQSLACDWNDSELCSWKAWNLDTFYTWETGRESWNQLSLLKDSAGNVVEFSKPLEVQYTHTDGRKLRLEYNGFGNLHGIPGKCVDPATNEVTSACNQDTRWVPEFNIADGAIVSGYLVKQLGMEQRMRVDNTVGACASLTPETLALPDAGTWVAPNIGSKPDVTTPPQVIGGVLARDL